MDTYRAMQACCLLAGLGVAAPVANAVTPEAAQFRIDTATIDGGGGRSAAAGFVVAGTIGQPDADPLQPASADAFRLVGGFWPQRAALVSDRIFANGFES
jgi:hypothetical protein